MKPATVHLLAQLIRHQRGMATSVEKWAASDGCTPKDVQEMVEHVRRVLNAYEAQLGRVITD